MQRTFSTRPDPGKVKWVHGDKRKGTTALYVLPENLGRPERRGRGAMHGVQGVIRPPHFFEYAVQMRY